MLNLTDIRATLRAPLERERSLPCHIAAFNAWVLSDQAALRTIVDEVMAFQGQSRLPDHVAALGFGAFSALLTPEECALWAEEIVHLKGRAFFAPGRPRRFEVDGVALLGVALGLSGEKHPTDRQWFVDLLFRSTKEVGGDLWQSGLVKAARLSLGETELRLGLPELAVAMEAKGLGVTLPQDLDTGWKATVEFHAHESGPARDAVRLAVFEHVLAKQGQIPIRGTTRSDLVALLQNVSRSMRLWTYEETKRTPKSAISKWDIENEYHVQNLLWTILAPVFSDLEAEENLPSIGHKNPRADIAIPSLRTIVEVKFMRHSGQSACAKITEEIAADASLYLSNSDKFDSIIAFVWDDRAQTEQHDELRSGLERINGILAAVILPRPLSMRKSAS